MRPAGHPRRLTHPRRLRREDGFTLLEAVIAFAIAAIALSVLFQGASAALRETAASRLLQGAVERAQSHLAAAGTLLGSEGERVEDGGDGALYHWHVTVTPEPAATVHRAAVGTGQALSQHLRLYRIVVDERWSDRGHPHAFTLRTTRLFVGPPGTA